MIGFDESPKSKFESTKINNCFFESCYNENPSKSFTNGEFKSCRLGDLEHVIAGAEEKSEKDRALIENELRMATARCIEECEIISITKKEFDERVNKSDVFVKGCLNALSYRLRQVEKKL